MNPIKIVAIDGSPRAEGLTRKLLVAAREAFAKTGAQYTIFDQFADKLPMYDGGGEKVVPETVAKLMRLTAEADGIVLCSPEYHGSMSAALKNALDWLSEELRGKAIGLFGGGGQLANSGATVQMMMTVRAMHGIVVPEAVVSVTNIWDAFGADGRLADKTAHARLEKAATKIVKYAGIFREHRREMVGSE